MRSQAVVGEQGVQEGTKHAPLRGSHVEGQRGKLFASLVKREDTFKKSRGKI